MIMQPRDLAQYLEFAKGLAQEAGAVMRRYFNADDIGTEFKIDSTPVTAADTAINQLVIDRVRAAYPDHGVIGEEDSYEEQRDYVWVVDPIDGTIPFSLGLPLSTFCLALVHKGNVQASVVYEPFLDRLFSASPGSGSFINGKKLKVSDGKTFKNSYISLSGWKNKGKKNLHSVILGLEEQGGRAIDILSYAYSAAMVASGELLVAGMTYGSPWDAAAVALIAEEAGGKVTDLQGNPRKFNEWGDGILITNGYVHNEVVRLIQNADTWD